MAYQENAELPAGEKGDDVEMWCSLVGRAWAWALRSTLRFAMLLKWLKQALEKGKQTEDDSAAAPPAAGMRAKAP